LSLGFDSSTVELPDGQVIAGAHVADAGALRMHRASDDAAMGRPHGQRPGRGDRGCGPEGTGV